MRLIQAMVVVCVYATTLVSAQEKDRAAEYKKEIVRIKKEVEGTPFKFHRAPGDRYLELRSKDSFYEKLDKTVLERYRRWANIADPLIVVTTLEGKITDVHLSADPWKAGTEKLQFTTEMHCVAARFLQRPADRKTFQQLATQMKKAIELHFGD